jgi:hypothetical protein
MGRENRGYKRIQELSKLDAITSDEVSAKYGIGRRASNLWIHTMKRKNLLEISEISRVEGHKNYVVSANGKAIAQLIEAIEGNYDEIAAQEGVDDPESILRKTKTKIRPSLTEPIVKLEIQAYPRRNASNHEI